MKRLAIPLLAAVLLFAACSGTDTGNFRVLLTDTPIPDAQAILVTVSEVTVHAQGGAFQTVSTGSQTYDLLKLRDREQQIVNVDLEAGSYTEIRLIVESGQIVIGDQTFQLSVPSSEVKIPVAFEVTGSGETRIVLDFDADNSIEVVGAGQSGQYILRPVVKVVSVSF